MNELNKFYQLFMQEIYARQLANEDGDTQEQAFTRYAVDMLSEAGETENAEIAFDQKELGRKGQHKINAFAIPENYETVDLFISIFESAENIQSIAKSEIDRAVTRISNFFRKAIYEDYANEVAESSQIFSFANTLATYKELRENLIRINVFILTNGTYKGDLPTNVEIGGYKVFYRVVDIDYLYKISEQSRVPIEIDFAEEGFDIPCLSANTDNEDYQAYIAIIPGECLASLYERFGARLLEQNVRAFLQFTGKINKGIRDTIKNEPQMFLAFNNGIAATADHIELDESGRNIKKISNLQIVNGGQTTASIYHTAKKDKVSLSNVFVQVKFSVIKRQDKFSEIVSRISRYANTQNKVNDADFTANNQYLVAVEKLSRYMLTPITINNNMQTSWFFERARGQYKTQRLKDGFTTSRQKAFDAKYPKNQMFTKVELAKYINAYQEVYEGKKIAIGPHLVVRGNEKNYARFIASNLPDNVKKINNVFFEDTIAKGILFKSIDKRYGTKVSGNNIGEIKQVVVPYTISLLNLITNKQLDLYKIWKNQQISVELTDFMYELMKQVNKYILDNSPVSNFIEWAKKEECWEQIKSNTWAFNIEDIRADLIDEKNPPKRNIISDTTDEDDVIKEQIDILRSIPTALWKKIAEWGQDEEALSPTLQSAARDIAYIVKNNRKFSETERRRAMMIYESVCKKNIELLALADELAEQTELQEPINQTNKDTVDITFELIEKMVAWDKRRRILKDWQWRVMDDVAQGRKPLTDQMKYAFYRNWELLKKRGFQG